MTSQIITNTSNDHQKPPKNNKTKDIKSYMPSATLPQSNNSTCATCKKEFKNSKGLARHQQNVQRYNKHQQELDKLPVNTVAEFKRILVTEIQKRLPLNFSKILNSDQWGKRIYSQNQQTYVVCLDPIPWSSDSQNQPEEIDPLEQLLQSTIKKHNIIKTRRPKFLRGEILIEWKKKRSKVNGIVNMVRYIHFNFYIAQSQNVQ
ncbi:unnamed protein product [Rhizophagus irregularis]|nr:unnamed protein product [Rhizophagus irregularis]